MLADGMGGYNAGEIASGMATAFIKSEMARWLTEAGRAPRPRKSGARWRSASTTPTAPSSMPPTPTRSTAAWARRWWWACSAARRLVLGHIGDSRCYRLRNGEFAQITKDHSLLQEQIDAGLITPGAGGRLHDQEPGDPCIGRRGRRALDLNEHEVEVGDWYLMCSDGLSDMVDDAEIASILGGPAPMEQKADSWLTAANDHGGRDNISVLLVQVDAASEKRGLISRLLGK
jgi:serine/threonine protein phosphatase PrpC